MMLERLRASALPIVFVATTTTIAFGLVAALALSGNLGGRDTVVADTIGEIEPEEVGHERDSIHLWFQASAFDPETQKAEFLVYPWPSADRTVAAFSSSTVASTDFSIFLDELDGSGRYDYRTNDIIGAIRSSHDVLNADDYGIEPRPEDSQYPFDSYLLDMWAQVSDLSPSDDLTPRRAFDFFYTNSVPGFSIEFHRIAGWGEREGAALHTRASIIEEREAGEISFIAYFQRTLAVRITVILLSALMLLNGASLVWTTAGVLARRRPPSMQALIWSAASVLATIQLRDLFPGRPRLGVMIDYLVFFPTMIVTMLVGVTLTVAWIKRPDYQV